MTIAQGLLFVGAIFVAPHIPAVYARSIGIGSVLVVFILDL